MNFSLDKSDKLLYNFEKIRIFTFTAFAIFAKRKGTRLDIDFRARRTTIQWCFHVLTALAKLFFSTCRFVPCYLAGNDKRNSPLLLDWTRIW